MTAVVQHCTTAPRHVITLSTPRQPAQLLGAHLLICMQQQPLSPRSGAQLSPPTSLV